MTAATNGTDGAGRGTGAVGGCLKPLAGLLGMLLLIGGVIAAVILPDSGYAPGFSMAKVWDAPYEGDATDDGGEVRLAGDAVVRGRSDGVTAFDVRSGKKRWEYAVPDRAQTCAMSSDPAAGVVLVAYREARPEEKDCVTVAAVDLADGRERWRADGVEADFLDNVVTAGGGLGVLPDGHRLRAVDLKTGAPRWTVPLPQNCDPHDLALAPKQVVAALMCGTEARLIAYDPANGTARWNVPVDARHGVDKDAELRVLSADPPAVRVFEADGKTSAVLAYGTDGRVRARIAGAGDYGRLMGTSVEGGRLFASAWTGSGESTSFSGIVAFDLASGEQLWRTKVAGDDFDVRDGRVTTVRAHRHGDLLTVLDAATGDEEDDRPFRDAEVRSVAGVLTHQDLVILAHADDGMPPFSVYERW
ncbi:PQQ-binding-like beta-propeller repeat protein [Streptomyces sp. NPDC126503]|uniref:outer membrane protein assembly factor BamB family protein n=1 Tax=Streptomyces sp. NPDC126503 TaxID=3155315 RepID=UPI003331A66A